MKKYTFILIIFLLASACSSGGVSQTSNPETTITISKLTDGRSTVTIPLSVFGEDSTALTGASIDVYVNALLVSDDIDPATFYFETSETVVFDVTGLVEGDVVEIRATLSDGSLAVFRGTVSDTADVEAPLLADDDSASGQAALESRDLSAAITAYCDPIDEGSTSSTLAFGCFLSKLLALPETTDAQNLLTALGEAPVDVKTLVLEGVFDGVGVSPSYSGAGGYANGFTYGNYPNLPLNDIINLHVDESLANIVVRLNTSGTTAEVLEAEIAALRDDFEYLESLLSIVVTDTAFSYTIPKELFSTETDLVVSRNDSFLFMSSMKTTIVGLNIIDAYDYGVTLSQILDGGNFNYQILVEDLNGTGATIGSVTVDDHAFLEMEDASLITNSETKFVEALEYLSTGMAALQAGEVSELFSPSFENTHTGEILTAANFGEVKILADELLESINTDTLVPLTIVSDHSRENVSVNLHEFFTNPPSAADVTGSDPFVYEDGTIQTVEVYFRDLLSGIAEF